MFGGVLQQFVNMGLNCFQRLSLLILLLALTTPALSRDWQGTGNMTQDNMTEIQTTINTYPITMSTDPGDIHIYAKNISTHLNQLWAPAWNVVIVAAGAAYDTVVYGYAFNNHWMWINGVTRPGSTFKMAYIIWKDFNCHVWKMTSEFGGSAFSSDQATAIQSYPFTQVLTDIWAEAHSFVNFVNSKTVLSSGAYSVVMSQDGMALFYGHICFVDNKFATRSYVQGYNDGAYLLFQTR